MSSSNGGRKQKSSTALPLDHSSIQDLSTRKLKSLEAVSSVIGSFKLDNSWRFSRELSLQFQYCPACGGNDRIVFYGKSEAGTQRYKCCECERQFVTQMDSIYPRLNRRDIFLREFEIERHKYWKPAIVAVLGYIESHRGRLLINRILKNSFSGNIRSQRDYDVLTSFIVHEAYNIVMAR